MLIDGVTFHNYQHQKSERFYAIKTCSKCDNCKRGGYTTLTQNLSWVNSDRYVKFNAPHRFIIQDLDGSLVNPGLAAASECGWVTPNHPHNLVTP